MVTNKKMRGVVGAVCVSIIALSANTYAGQAEAKPNAYLSKQFGISFIIPEGVNLYTAENPGPLSSQISEKEPLILVNPVFPDENVILQLTGSITESDVIGYKKLLEKRQTMPMPEYKRISVAMIKIGKDQKKIAVEHIFYMKGNIKGKIRQITFAHNGKGFTFGCGTSRERFDTANKMFFDALFNSMTFE